MKTTQLRLSDEIAEYIKTEAEKINISQNSFTLTLISLGKKVWDSDVVTQIKGE